MAKKESEAKPCPNCGHCPTCGHSPQKMSPQPWVIPFWYPAQPYWIAPLPSDPYRWTWTTTSGTANDSTSYRVTSFANMPDAQVSFTVND